MPRFACLALALASVACAQGTETRIHDISFLTSPIPDQPGDTLGIFDDPGIADKESAWQPFTPEQVVELVTRTISPGSWGDGNQVEVTSEGVLCVRAPADVQEAVEKLIASLSSSIGPQIQVSVRRVRVSAALLARLSPAGPLDEARRKALDEALAAGTEAVAAGERRVTAFSGQRVHVKDATAVAYLRDYDGFVAQESAIADPVPADVQEGSIVDVTPFLSPDERWIAIECRIRSSLILGIETFDSGTPLLGTLQLPDVETTTLSTNVVVPDRCVAMAGAILLPRERWEKAIRYECILVSATRIGPPRSPAPQDGSKPVRVIDVGYLFHPYPDFPGPRLTLSAGVDDPAAGATFEIGEEVAADLVALVSTHVAPDTWTADHLLEPSSAGRLLAKNTAEAMAQLDRFLADLARPIASSVSVEARFLSVDARALAALSADLGPLAADSPFLTDDQAAKLMARAQAEDGVREVGVASAYGMAGSRFSLSSLRATAYVQDYDVEVAAKSKIGDPVVGVLTVGTVLDVRPQVSPDGARVLVDFRPVHAVAAGSVDTLDTHTGDVGKLQLPSVRSHGTRTSLLLDSGRWFAVGLGGGREETVIVLVRATALPAR